MAKDFDIYVNEALGVVVAKHPNASKVLREDFDRQIDKLWGSFGVRYTWDDFGSLANKWLKKYGPVMDNLVGKARCNFEDGDEFDKAYGEKLAKKRLAEKLEFYWCDFYCYMQNVMMEHVCLFNDRVDFHYERANILATQIAKMTEEGEF